MMKADTGSSPAVSGISSRHGRSGAEARQHADHGAQGDANDRPAEVSSVRATENPCISDRKVSIRALLFQQVQGRGRHHQRQADAQAPGKRRQHDRCRDQPDAHPVAKYRAALARRDMLDPDVVVIARTDARAAVGCGMDKVMRRVTEAFPGTPIYVNASSIKPVLSADEYGQLGAATYISVSKAAQLMTEAFLRDCRDRGADAFPGFMERQASSRHGTFSSLDLTGFPTVLGLESRFPTKEQLAKYEGSLGEYDPRKEKAG